MKYTLLFVIFLSSCAIQESKTSENCINKIKEKIHFNEFKGDKDDLAFAETAMAIYCNKNNNDYELAMKNMEEDINKEKK